MYQSFEELEVWKKARELKKEISQLVKSFPAEEKYRLTDQLIRSSRSVNTQIAEGHGRRTWPDRLRFSVISRGSLSETLSHLRLMRLMKIILMKNISLLTCQLFNLSTFQPFILLTVKYGNQKYRHHCPR